MVETEQFFEDYKLGHIRTTAGRTITETDIVMHAMHSGDFYPHHVDAEFAKILRCDAICACVKATVLTASNSIISNPLSRAGAL